MMNTGTSAGADISTPANPKSTLGPLPAPMEFVTTEPTPEPDPLPTPTERVPTPTEPTPEPNGTNSLSRGDDDERMIVVETAEETASRAAAMTEMARILLALLQFIDVTPEGGEGLRQMMEVEEEEEKEPEEDFS